MTNTKMAKIYKDMSKISEKLWRWSVVMWDDSSLSVDMFTTWSTMLDIALGWWYPIWRMVEIFGIQSSWKTMMALHAIREMQRTGWLCSFIDIERTVTTERMESLGIDVGSLLIVKPNYAEDAIDSIETLVENGVKLIVVDSVAAMLPRQEANAETWDTQVMVMWRIMSKAMRKLTGICNDHWSTIIFINQTRKTITMSKDNNVTTGGNALPFYASQRIKIHRNQSESSQLKDEDKNVVWANVQFTIVKNKVSSPFEKLVLDISYDWYINENKEVIKLLLDKNLLKNHSRMYTIKFNGKEIKVWTTVSCINKLLEVRESRAEIMNLLLDYFKDVRRKRSELARAKYF